MTDSNFLRGSRTLAPCTHIVEVESQNGSRIFRRCSLTAEQMAQVEALLMRLQHDGEIRSYLLAAANDATFPELTAWLAALAFRPEQVELLNISQNSLFSGGAA